MSAEFEIARDKDGFLNCKYCPRIFLTNILFENHLVSQHKKDTETKPDINNIQQLQTKTDESSIQENIQIEKCSLVNLSFVSQGDLKLNRRDEHQKMAASNQGSECKNLFKCEMNFIRPIQNGDQQLGLNIDTVHRKLSPYQSQECNKSFGPKQHFQRHIDTAQIKLTPYLCQECKKS